MCWEGFALKNCEGGNGVNVTVRTGHVATTDGALECPYILDTFALHGRLLRGTKTICSVRAEGHLKERGEVETGGCQTANATVF